MSAPRPTKLLTDAEVQQLILVRIAGGDNGTEAPISRAEIQQFIEWAESVRADSTLLGLCLEGKLRAWWNGEDWTFGLLEPER